MKRSPWGCRSGSRAEIGRRLVISHTGRHSSFHTPGTGSPRTAAPSSRNRGHRRRDSSLHTPGGRETAEPSSFHTPRKMKRPPWGCRSGSRGEIGRRFVISHTGRRFAENCGAIVAQPRAPAQGLVTSHTGRTRNSRTIVISHTSQAAPSFREKSPTPVPDRKAANQAPCRSRNTQRPLRAPAPKCAHGARICHSAFDRVRHFTRGRSSFHTPHFVISHTRCASWHHKPYWFSRS